jgi:hypothetical protein
LNRRQTSTEDEFSKGLNTMLLEQPADQGVHKRAVCAADSGEINYDPVTRRNVQYGVDFRHAETIGIGSVAQAGTKFVAQMDFMRHVRHEASLGALIDAWRLAG